MFLKVYEKIAPIAFLIFVMWMATKNINYDNKNNNYYLLALVSILLC